MECRDGDSYFSLKNLFLSYIFMDWNKYILIFMQFSSNYVPGGSCFNRLSCSLSRRSVVRPRNTPKGSSIIVLPERSSSSRRTRPRNSPSGRCSRALEARWSTTRRGVPRNRVPASCLITLDERSLKNRVTIVGKKKQDKYSTLIHGNHLIVTEK